MAGIAGIARRGESARVEKMLEKIRHRGPCGRAVIESEAATLGVVWPKIQEKDFAEVTQGHAVWDGMFGGEVERFAGDSPLALAAMVGSELLLARDGIGIAPLYTGEENGVMVFASEVKALLDSAQQVREFPPGHRWTTGGGFEPFFKLEKKQPIEEGPEQIAKELRQRLEASVRRFIKSEDVGSWLSGGLDSSTLAALARPHVRTLHTFAAGLAGAPDLDHAREVAEFIGSEHHEVIATFEQMLAALPDVIYHLESFDALLVRSSIMNNLVSKLASEHVGAVFSGEGGDELFAGYDYIKSLDPSMLADELIDITSRLHNTALQRVDRSSTAHGTVAYVGFLSPDVVEYVLRIPTSLKLHDGVEKWILRRAIEGGLPERVLNRPKAKFWEGAGVVDLVAAYADEHVTDGDFARERILPNGWELNSKEELMYYRVFRERFGELTDIEWMGRTKKVTP